ncbi:MAG: hypothetical protein F6J97_23390 [Leptolyngbya sp. SIO4C1]|nr:hypothetical protein [Leptolyngbya sp. SIO4C1]
MKPEDSPTTLDLLVPWEIPLAHYLRDPERQQIRASLQQLLQALQTPDFDQARLQIEQILASLAVPETQSAQVKSTKTGLTSDDINDYDQYFGVNHVQTEAIALCLVRGLLTNCHRFMTLCAQQPQLDPQQIALQKQGFISYVHLLARAFYLEDLS